MPLPLAPLLLRIGALAVAGYGVARWISARSGDGRREQRAEDALDDLDEGLLTHSPKAAMRGEAAPGETVQRNASFRLRRSIGFRGRVWEIDAGLIARLRLKERRS